MKNFFKALSSFLNSIAQARAASSLARMYKYEEARNVILRKS